MRAARPVCCAVPAPLRRNAGLHFARLCQAVAATTPAWTQRKKLAEAATAAGERAGGALAAAVVAEER